MRESRHRVEDKSCYGSHEAFQDAEQVQGCKAVHGRVQRLAATSLPEDRRQVP